SRDLSDPGAPNAVLTLGLPCGQCGAATTTRKEPSGRGLNLTPTVRVSTTDAVTFNPVAVISARDPNCWPEAPGGASSFQVSASTPTSPAARAWGCRPSHRPTRAVCAVLGSAPVTSTT